jgi:hypothetical protein
MRQLDSGPYSTKICQYASQAMSFLLGTSHQRIQQVWQYDLDARRDDLFKSMRRALLVPPLMVPRKDKCRDERYVYKKVARHALLVQQGYRSYSRLLGR